MVKCDANVHDAFDAIREVTVRRVGGGASSLALMFCGAIAGGTAKTIIAPADRIKIIFQTSPQMAFSYRKAIAVGASICRSSGPMALWRGNAATLARVLPYSGINFMLFAKLHDSLVDADVLKSSVLTRFLAGAGSGLCASGLTYPLEVLRARMAVDISHKRWSYLECLKSVYAAEGVRGLYSGLTPTLMGVVPYAGISFMTYETLKAKYDCDALPWKLLAGAAAGLTAQIATYPIDVVRRRMQVTPREYSSGVVSALLTIWKAEGAVRGLYRGLSMNFIKGPVSVAVSLTMNDFLKSFVT